jgi:transposase
MYALATENPQKYIEDIKFREVLNFKKSVKSQTGFKVSIRQYSIDKLSYNGWFLLLSNTITDPIEAITVYRNKNSVEDAFNIVKNFLGHHRMRIHSNNAMISKFL